MASSVSFLLSLLRRARRGDLLFLILALFLGLSFYLRYAGADSLPVLMGGQDPQEEGCARLQEGAAAVVGDKIPERGEPVRFLMLNTENYFVAGEKSRSPYNTRPKRENSCEAVADVIASARPEIVGLVEIGGPKSLEDLRGRLSKRGLDYPYYRVLTREGEDRALAILSQHPIAKDNSKAEYGLYGTHRRRMLRGILDVCIRLKDGRVFRVMGVHLKSHVASDDAAADNLRRQEAYTLARYLQEEIRKQPKMPLAVFGDWNDGPSDKSLQILTQGISADAAMTRLRAEDSRGQDWTIYYRGGDAYLSYDLIYVNGALKKRMGKQYKSGVVDIPAAKAASDHRAVWCEFR